MILLSMLLCANILVAQGSNGTDTNNTTPKPSISIVEAAAKGDLEKVKQHLSSGTQINDRNGDHDSTALHAAAYYGKLEVVKYLIEKGAGLNTENKRGQTPLDAAWADHKDKDKFSGNDRRAKRETAGFIEDRGGKPGKENGNDGFFQWWMLGAAIPLVFLLIFVFGIIYAIKTKPTAEAMPTPTKKFVIVTSPSISGKKIVRVLGLVRGNTIRARHVGKDIMAGFRNMVGGEVTEYAKLLAESREQAIDRMLLEAEGLGANAVISVDFQTSVIMGGAAEMMAYGTAVVIEDE